MQREISGSLRRVAWFSLFGLMAFAVNLELFHLLLGLRMGVVAAGVASAVIAMLLSFIPNDAVTWRSERRGSILRRLGLFCTSSITGIVVNAAVLAGLMGVRTVNPMTANILGIGIGTLCKFVLNNYWTWGVPKQKAESLIPPPIPSMRPSDVLRSTGGCATLRTERDRLSEVEELGKDGVSPVIDYSSRSARRRMQRDAGVFGFLRRGTASNSGQKDNVDCPQSAAVDAPAAGHEVQRLMGRLAPQDMLLITRFIEYLAAERAQKKASNDMRGPEIYTQVAAAAEGAAPDVPVLVVVGPCSGMASIEHLVDELEEIPGLDIHFRAFHGGFYRLDGRAPDASALAHWVSRLEDVESVALDRETLHVVPRAPRT